MRAFPGSLFQQLNDLFFGHLDTSAAVILLVKFDSVFSV